MVFLKSVIESWSGDGEECQRALTVGRSSSPEGCDLRLAQHLRELGSPLRTDVVAAETTNDGRGADSEREQACHGALTQK